MTTQDKINSLAQAALDKEPAGGPPSGNRGVDIDPGLRSMIEERDARMTTKRKRLSMAITSTFLAMAGSAVGWVTLTESGRQHYQCFATALQECKGDLKNLTGILAAYQKQIDKLAVYSARVDAATVALGGDPVKDEANSNLDLDAEMKRMAGEGGGPTTAERDEKLRSTFGAISKMAGQDPDKAKKATESDVKF